MTSSEDATWLFIGKLERDSTTQNLVEPRRTLTFDGQAQRPCPDFDCAHAQIKAQGRVTAQSIHAFYVIVKTRQRANPLMSQSFTVEIDMVNASIELDALDQLRACSQSHRLQTRIDPFQSNCRLSIRDDFAATGTATLAARASHAGYAAQEASACACRVGWLRSTAGE